MVRRWYVTCVVFFIMSILFPISTAYAQPQLLLESEVSEPSIQVGKDVMVRVNLKNPTNYTLDKFDMQVTQTGFTVKQSKTWPEKIEAWSNLTGTYTLEATKDGNHRIGIITTFGWKDGNVSKQGYAESIADSIRVSELPLKASEQMWGGITAIVAGAVGAIIAGIAGYIRGRLEDKKKHEAQQKADVDERKGKHDRTKSLLLSELETNRYRIEKKMGSRMLNWDMIMKEGLYPTLSKNDQLAKDTVELYVNFEDYSNEVAAGNVGNYDKNDLLLKLENVKRLLNAWEFAE